MINKVTLIGNLGRDPEIRHFEGGSKVTKFSVATNENYQDRGGQWQTRTEWHEVVLWAGQAERAEKTLKKGHLVYVEGKITSRKWQDKEGNDRYTTEIVGSYFRSLEKRESGASESFPSNDFPSIEDHFASAPMDQGQQPMSDEDDLPF